jgi:undecaprenyl-phosphate 4-deoxy-4-formamido-L-arabinose transferase
VLAGFRVSRGDVVVTLDADLQNPPEEIPKLLDKIRDGFDVVGGVRRGRQDSPLRKALTALVHGFSKSGTDYGCMLRAYRRVVVRRILRCRERTLFIPALAARLARRVVDVPIAHDKRRFGRSRYSALRLHRLGFDWLTGFSVLPVQMVSLFGLVLSSAGAAVGVGFLIRRLQGGPESQVVYALFALLFAVLGAVFVAIGVVGEYVVRISSEVRHRPRYTIESVRRGVEARRS